MHRYRLEVAQILDNFIHNASGPRDWDDFIFRRIDDPQLDTIRARCDGLSAEFPAEQSGHYCGPAGLAVMRDYIAQLRQPSGRATTVTDAAGLLALDKTLHDYWFDLTAVVRTPGEVLISMWFEKHKGHRFAGFRSTPKMPPGTWAVVRIKQVVSEGLVDKARIHTYMMNDLSFDPRSRTLALRSSFPLVMRFTVDALDVSVDMEGAFS